MSIAIFGCLLLFACDMALSQYSQVNTFWQISEETEMCGQCFKPTLSLTIRILQDVEAWPGISRFSNHKIFAKSL
jgi:hypothetical protein